MFVNNRLSAMALITAIASVSTLNNAYAGPKQDPNCNSNTSSKPARVYNNDRHSLNFSDTTHLNNKIGLRSNTILENKEIAQRARSFNDLLPIAQKHLMPPSGRRNFDILRCDLNHIKHQILSETPKNTDGIQGNFKGRYLKESKSYQNLLNKGVTDNNNALKEMYLRIHWGADQEIKKDKPVTIMHGGGMVYLLDFCSGERRGYSLEAFDDIDNKIGKKTKPILAAGIQVSPIVKDQEFNKEKCFDTSLFYAEKASYKIDFPAVLIAKTTSGNLEIATNNYEAGLLYQNRNKVENPKIIPLASMKNLKNYWTASPEATKTIQDTFRYVPQYMIDRLAKFNGDLQFMAYDLATRPAPRYKATDYGSKRGTMKAL